SAPGGYCRGLGRLGRDPRTHRALLTERELRGHRGSFERLSVRLPESPGWRRTDCRRVLSHLVDADVGLHPPLVRLLVDLALPHDEAGVQPTVVLMVAEQLHAGEDRAPHTAGGFLLDAL